MQVLLARLSSLLLSGGVSCAAHWACKRDERWSGKTGATRGGGTTLVGGATLGKARGGAVRTRMGKTRGASSVAGCRTRAGTSGFEMNTSRDRRGGRMGRLTGIGGDGTKVTVVWPLMTIVVSQGERRSELGRGG